MRTIFTILILLIAFCLKTVGQTGAQANLTWNVTTVHDQSNNGDLLLKSRFQTSAGLIQRVQKEGAVVYDFAVTAVSGTWPDISNDGEITFQVRFRDREGSFRFSQSQGKISILPVLLKDGKNLLTYEFTVSTITNR